MSFTKKPFGVFETIGFTILGGMAWTFVEYMIHRFVFHYRPNSDFGKKIIFLSHGVHHDYPNDAKRLVLPPSISIPLSTIFYYLFLLLISKEIMPPFFGGFLIGYLFYDIGHYAIHRFKLSGVYWKSVKDHHMHHHFLNPDKGYGVSSKFWDIIFMTAIQKKNQKK